MKKSKQNYLPPMMSDFAENYSKTNMSAADRKAIAAINKKYNGMWKAIQQEKDIQLQDELKATSSKDDL
jgi:hypothetical protein